MSRPVVLLNGPEQAKNHDPNQRIIEFLFPKARKEETEAGSVKFIDGDMPRIIVRAGEQVRVDIERKDPKKE